MLSDRVRAPALALILAALTSACGDDEATPDAGGGDPDASVDAGGDSGPVDTGEDLCPGQLTFEALVADVVSGEPTFEVDVVEEGGPASTQSAPNGRAQLCLPADADFLQIRSTKDDYLERVDTLAAGAIEVANAAVQPYPLDVLGGAAADELLDGLGATREEKASLLLVSVVSYPDGEPLVGANISVANASDGAFARDADLEFTATGGDGFGLVGEGRVVLFVNVDLGEGQTNISVEPPGDRVTCVGPPTVELEPGGLSGALFACQ